MKVDDERSEDTSTKVASAENRAATLIAELDASEHKLRSLYEVLAQDPDRHDGLREEIEALQAHRQVVAQGVGLAIAAWLRLGGSVELTAPPDEDAPVPVAASTGIEAPSVDVASDAARTAFADLVNTNGLAGTEKRTVSASPLGVLRRLMAALGPPPRDAALHELITEVERLDHVSDVCVDDWALMSRDAQITWVAMLAARARFLKSVQELPAAARDQLKVMILRLPNWSARNRPGHIHGLAIDHDPVSASWWQDAHHLWSELDEIAAEPTVQPRSAVSPPAPLSRPNIPSPPKSEREIPLDPSWSMWPYVRGKRALIVGGTPKEERRAALEKMFAFDDLHWADVDGPRRVEALAQRIERGSVDLVLIVQTLISHKDSGKIIEAATSGGTAWALVGGYGVSAVKAGLERFLVPESLGQTDS